MASNFDGSFETLRWHLHDKSEMPVSLAAVWSLMLAFFLTFSWLFWFGSFSSFAVFVDMLNIPLFWQRLQPHPMLRSELVGIMRFFFVKYDFFAKSHKSLGKFQVISFSTKTFKRIPLFRSTTGVGRLGLDLFDLSFNLQSFNFSNLEVFSAT